jgi:hypothetical protein
LFSALSTPRYTKCSVWSQLESSLVGFKLWTDSYFLIPFLALCSRASQPSRPRIGGWW